MKKFVTILTLVFCWFSQAAAQKSPLYELFDKYKDTEGVTSIKIGKPMFGMLSKLTIADDELAELKPVLNKIKGLRILVLEKPEKLDSTKAEFKKMKVNFNALQTDISQSLSNLKYEELMTVDSKGNKVKFLSTDAVDGVLDNLVLSVNDDKSTVLMLLDGKISMDDVNLLANETQKNKVENSTAYGQEIRKLGSFSGIEVKTGIKVDFTQGTPQNVTVETDEGKLKYVKTEVVNGILKIFIDNQGEKNLNFKKLTVNITAPKINSLSAGSGSSFTTLNTLNSGNFTADLGSGAHADVDLIAENVKIDAASGSSGKFKIKADSLNTEATSGSSLKLSGSVAIAELEVSSAASVNAVDLNAGVVKALTSSSGNVKVYATDELTAVVNSGGSVTYKGVPKKLSKSDNSGGQIKHID